MKKTQLVLVRIAGGFLVVIGLFGIFLLVNPATVHRLARLAPIYAMLSLIIGVGMLFLRKWAAALFVLLAVGQLAFFVRDTFGRDIPLWVLYLNALLLAIPVWACVGSWRQLR